MSDSSSRNNPGDPSSAPRLTPKGRISKAKKGIRDFHICADCGKTYSRAEHLRRHTQSHDDTKLKCSWPRCRKAFSRNDLLRRHESKHAETRQLSSSGSSSTTRTASERRPSIAITAATPPTSDLTIGFGVSDGSVANPFVSSAPLLGDISRHDGFTTLPELKPEFETSSIASTFSQLPAIPLGAISLPYTDVTDPWTQFCGQDFQSVYASLPTLPLSSPWTDIAAASASTVTTPLQSTWLAPVLQSSTHSTASSPLLQAEMSSANLGLDIPTLDPLELTWSTLQTATQNLTLEPSFHEYTLSQHLSQETRENYLAAYQTGFDPFYPVVHRQIYSIFSSNPLLEAAVLAVGAQYSDTPFAKSDSRLLYERCRDAINKHTQSFSLNCSLANMQAIFLIEFLGIFRARRIVKQLSEAFQSVNQQLWHQHNVYHSRSPTRSQLNLMLRPPKQTLSEDQLQQRWHTWLLTHSYQRLHIACQTLRAQEALLLPRPQPQQLELDVGFTLWLPMPFQLWSTNSAADWLQGLDDAAGLTTVDMCHSLDDIAAGINPTPYDDFQSSALLAVYTSSVANATNEYASHTSGLHAAFSPENYILLKNSLSQSSNSSYQLEATRLAANAPLKALLAVSGESWLLGQRLSSSAQEGSQILELHKRSLRSWAQSLHPNFAIASLLDDMTGSSTDPITLSTAQRSLICAKRIISMALETSKVPCFGAELAIYYAALVLWTLTYANVPPVEVATSSDTYDDINIDGMNNLQAFLAEGAPSMLTQSAVTPSDSWRPLVNVALDAALGQLDGGDDGKQKTSSGELLDGAVGVLTRLRQRGWNPGWF